MENNEVIEIKEYLESIYKYMDGDLAQIFKISSEIESQQNSFIPTPTPSIQLNDSISPSTTTEATTSGPNSNFEDVKNRLTIPIATTLFSIADILGGLFRDFDSPIGFTQSTLNLKHFFKELVGITNENQINVLVEFYRHGLAHNYFPKLGLAVSYHTQAEDRELFYKEGMKVVLNVKKLEKLVMNKLFDVCRDPNISNYQNKFNSLMDYYRNSSGFQSIRLLFDEL